MQCNSAQPQRPINVGAYPLSDKIMLVVRDKPLVMVTRTKLQFTMADKIEHQLLANKDLETQGFKKFLD